MFSHNLTEARLGMRHGIPIMLGYFAVAFALGITARNAGLSVWQAGVASMTNMASAGEYAGFQTIRERAGLIETALMTLVANARYLLMSCALSQKLSQDLRAPHRLLMGMTITDEIFALSVARTNPLNPWYSYGALLVSCFGWTAGTMLGLVVGNALPARLVQALSISLYGMFLASIIPAARKERAILILIAVSMALSGLCAVLPGIRELSTGTRIILLTVVISAVAAWVRPVDMGADDER